MSTCSACGGHGFVLKPPVFGTVTRDMAIDAGQPSLEGSPDLIEPEEIVPCPKAPLA